MIQIVIIDHLTPLISIAIVLVLQNLVVIEIEMISLRVANQDPGQDQAHQNQRMIQKEDPERNKRGGGMNTDRIQLQKEKINPIRSCSNSMWIL